MFSKKFQSVGYVVLLLLSITFLFSCFPKRDEPPTIKIMIENTLPIKQTDVPIILKVSELRKVAEDFSPDLYIITPSEKPKKGEQAVKIASQADDMDYDGEIDEIIFIVDLKPEEVKTVLLYYPPANQREKVTFGHARRTKAGIFPELGGAALESELAAYLIDSQNTVSPMGKSSSGLMLNQYAKSRDEAELVPIIQGEKDLIGCGGFALFQDDTLLPISSDQSERYARVLADGAVRSAVELIFPNCDVAGVSLNINAIFSIVAGHREVMTQLELEGDKPFPQIATGLPYALTENNREDGYAYNWNSSRNIGTALIYPTEKFSEFVDAKGERKNSTAIFKLDTNGMLTYRTLAIAGQGESTIEDQSGFESFLEVVTAQINSPPIVKILPPEKPKEKN